MNAVTRRDSVLTELQSYRDGPLWPKMSAVCLGPAHSAQLRDKTESDMYNLLWDDYKAFVLGNLNELLFITWLDISQWAFSISD